MKITVVHGQCHKGNTWHMAQCFLDALNRQLPHAAEVKEIFLPQQAPGYCVGCFNCILKDEALCPEAETIRPILEALDQADLLVFDSPCYIMNMTGQLKAFFDHTGYRCMVHRPEPSMFSKTAVVFSTAAGGGAGRTTKTIQWVLTQWGVAKIYRYGKSVAASAWEEVPEKRKRAIAAHVQGLASKVAKTKGRAKPGLPAKLMFGIMRMGAKAGWNPADQQYWEKQGWFGKARPWKKASRQNRT